MTDLANLSDWIATATGDDPDAAARAQQTLFEHYSPEVYRLCLGLLGDVADAEEVMQDAFVYALRNLRRFDPAQAGFRTWLFMIATSRCRNKRRRKWLPQVSLSAANTVSDSDGNRPVEAAMQARGVRRELWRALQALPYAQREALVLRYFGAMAYKEIGALLKCNPKTAESRVRLGIKGLRGILAGSALARDVTWMEEPGWSS